MAESHFQTNPARRWQWPRVPSAVPVRSASDDGSGQACRIETGAGDAIEATLLHMDPSVGVLKYRNRGNARTVTLPFWRLRRLTLTTSIALERKHPSLALPESPAHPCSYLLNAAESGQAALRGRTIGHVRAREGIYLFSAVEGDQAVQRVFVPASAYSSYLFGRSAEEAAPERGLATPAELLAAIAQQDRISVEPLGNTLVEMGLLTPAQLDEALVSQICTHTRLGEILVAKRIIARADLHRALARKMGYPMVDLVRFPIDPAATKLLPLKMAVNAQTVPLMRDGRRLIVAIDKPSRTINLRHLQAFVDVTLVPVMAPKSMILDILTIMTEHSVWSGVPLSLRFFPTTM